MTELSNQPNLQFHDAVVLLSDKAGAPIVRFIHCLKLRRPSTSFAATLDGEIQLF
jgi:hypothetical protein